MSNNLTPYDTGARAEPKPWTPTKDEDYGKVDFTDDADEDVATIYVERNPTSGYTVHVYTERDVDVELSGSVRASKMSEDISPVRYGEATVSAVAERLRSTDQDPARVLAMVLGAIGSDPSWSMDTLDAVMDCVRASLDAAALPDPGGSSDDDASLEFWCGVAGIEYEQPDHPWDPQP